MSGLVLFQWIPCNACGLCGPGDQVVLLRWLWPCHSQQPCLTLLPCCPPARRESCYRGIVAAGWTATASWLETLARLPPL